MANSSHRHRQAAAKPEDAISELRLLIREAHEAMAGLTDSIREAKHLIEANVAEAVDRGIETAVNVKIAELDTFLKAEAARVSEQMTDEMVKAREWMMHNLELISVTETPEGLKAEFNTKEL